MMCVRDVTHNEMGGETVATINNNRGRAIVVETSDEGLELTIEQVESGESEGIVLSLAQAKELHETIGNALQSIT